MVKLDKPKFGKFCQNAESRFVLDADLIRAHEALAEMPTVALI